MCTRVHLVTSSPRHTHFLSLQRQPDKTQPQQQTTRRAQNTLFDVFWALGMYFYFIISIYLLLNTYLVGTIQLLITTTTGAEASTSGDEASHVTEASTSCQRAVTKLATSQRHRRAVTKPATSHTGNDERLTSGETQDTLFEVS
jgi:hypothetical protein